MTEERKNIIPKSKIHFFIWEYLVVRSLLRKVVVMMEDRLMREGGVANEVDQGLLLDD